MATENGWEPSHAGPDILEWRTVPGTNPPVHLQVMKGWPSAVMIAYAADYNAYIEPLRDADSASFTPTNSVATSNHLNGTAMDLNWNDHPFRVSNAGFDPAKQARMRELLAFYNFKGVQIMWWANDWNSPKDAMHHQMGYNTWMNPVVQEFINERIRPDGFSTYKRGGSTAPPPAPTLSKADQYAVAIIGEGRRRNITPRGIQIALSVALVESGLKMYANSNVPQSLSIPHDAVGSDHDSLGLFQQRCPMWGPAEVLMNPALSAGLFYDRLTKMDYNNTSRAPGDYAADVQRPAAQYRGRYQERMGDAVALYNRLADTPVQGEDQLSAEAERMIREMYTEWNAGKRGPSRAFVASDGNGVDSPLGFLYNIDANVWNQQITWAYLFGVKDAEQIVNAVAQTGVLPDTWAAQQVDAQGRRWLSEFGQQYCQGLIGLRKAMQTAFRDGPPAVAPQVDTSGLSAENAWLRAENARLQAAQFVQPAADVELAQVAQLKQEPAVTATGFGQVVGKLYSVVEELRLADSLNIEERATLSATIKILETKNGAQL